MGLWQAVAARVRAAFMADPAPRPIDQLFAEMMSSSDQVTRREAFAVPAVIKGRNMLASIATLPLEQVDPAGAVVPSSFLAQIDPDVANVVTLAQTIEDLVFEGIAWWEIVAYGWDEFPFYARRVDPALVSLTPPAGGVQSPLPSGRDPRGAAVWINGRRVDAENVIRFDSPNPPVLMYGRAIKRANLLDKAAAMYATDPRPLDFLTPHENAEPITDDDGRKIVAEWRASRRRRSTAWLPKSIKYGAADTPSPSDLQLVELQARAALDIANELGVDPEDLGVSTTSRTYSNNIDRRRDRINEVYAPYMRAITDRLSMGDVTKRGYTVRFNLNEYLKSNPTEQVNVLNTAKTAGAIDATEMRNAIGYSGPAPSSEEPPAPAGGDSAGGDVTDPTAVDADARPAMGFVFSARSYTFEGATFTADSSARTIEGILMPWGKIARKYGMAFRFEKGSLQWSDVSRVKLTRDHGEAIGVATHLENRREGLFARFRVARIAAGDEVLSLADDGVYDGLSAGTDFDLEADTMPDPRNKGVTLVKRADLREGAATALPAFDDARVTKVAASRNGRNPMEECASCGLRHAADVACPTTPPTTTPPTQPPAASAGLGGLNLTGDQLAAILSRPNGLQALQTLGATPAELEPKPERREFVDPTRRPVPMAAVREPSPYRFDRAGNLTRGSHDFSTDLITFGRERDGAAYERALAFVQENWPQRPTSPWVAFQQAMQRAEFAPITVADVDDVNPARQRPDMFVDQIDFVYPLWQMINKGTLTDVTPFIVPKFNASAGLVGDHVANTEPAEGSYTTVPQTITPTALSGKYVLLREVFDQGGNPMVSNLIWQQAVREWFEDLETASGTFLNTLVAALDVNLGVNPTDAVFDTSWTNAISGLQFVRGGNRLRALATHVDLYQKFANAKDLQGRKMYPIIGPQNATGSATPRWGAIDTGGIVAVPAWGLGATSANPSNSWLFAPEDVSGWASAPQRIDIMYQVKTVEIGIWGYKAFANTRIDGVRQLIFDPTT